MNPLIMNKLCIHLTEKHFRTHVRQELQYERIADDFKRNQTVVKHLFQNFLQDHRVYRLNEQYYNQLFSKMLNREIVPFYTTTFKNGTPFYNANPIFSALHEGRIVRIIQKEATDTPKLKAWLDEFDGKEELVLSMELTDEFLPKIRFWVQQWWIDSVPKETMQHLIQHSTL